jgi:hypothetical protein
VDFIGVLLITESTVQLSGMKFGGRIAPPAYNYTIRFESGRYHPLSTLYYIPLEERKPMHVMDLYDLQR